MRAVVSTSALELGIDIGALDVSVMAGYPGTIAATWQRAGRAGRRAGRSAAVLVASSAPLDQFIVRNPDYFFGALARARADQPRQPAGAARSHQVRRVRAAVRGRRALRAERRGPGSAPGQGVDVQQVLALLAEEGFVHHADGSWNWTHESYPADAVSLRSVSSDNFVIVDITGEARVIGETDFTSAPSTLHEKAIYILEGQLYQVERFDFEGRKAYVRSVDCDYYTDAISYTKVTVLEELAERGLRARARQPRRGPRRVAGRRLQEDSVLHQRERRLGRARSARAADAHDVVVADDARGGGGRLPYATDDRRDGISALAYGDAHGGAAAADVRSAGLGVSVDTDGDRPMPRRRSRAPALGRAARVHLRQLSRRHRLQRAAATRCRRSCSTPRAT